MKVLFLAALVGSVIGTASCAAPIFDMSMVLPIQRNAETIVWSANQIANAREAIRLSKELEVFDAREVACLATNIYHEARSESLEGQAAVAWVTINRRDEEGFRDTICKVVHQRWRNDNDVYICQFSWYCDDKSDTTSEKEAYAIAHAIAKDIYYNVDSLEDLTKGSTYYHATYVSPKWANRFELVTLIGKHKFYKS